MLSVAKTLAATRNDITYPGHALCPITSPDTDDEDWLPVVGELGWAVILRDKKIRTRSWQRALIVEHGIQAFSLTKAGNAKRDELLELVLKFWDEIVKKVDEEPGPYIYAVRHQGLRPLNLPR
jgi:hypothetical protein